MYVGMYVLCTYVRSYVRPYVCTILYVCLYVCTYVRMYVRTYVCMYVRTYLRMYLCMYVYILKIQQFCPEHVLPSICTVTDSATFCSDAVASYNVTLKYGDPCHGVACVTDTLRK